MLLDVQDIQKSFQNTEVLKGVSFQVEKGQVLSIIGSSGSGKTTLLRCLNFLETPDTGRILLNGEKIYDRETDDRKENQLREKRLHFGLVFQQFHLFPQYTALRNVTLAPELLELSKLPKNQHDARKKDIEKRALTLLDKVGLSDKLASYPHQLSGGQQQRVAIARALALQPDILCFDEPTSALDPELTGEVLRVIKSLRSDHNTMIIVTHEMEFAAQISDHVIFMANGIIEEQGTPAEIFGNPQSEKTKAFVQKPQIV